MKTPQPLVPIAIVVFSACSSITECEVDNPNRGVATATGPSIEEISVDNASHGAVVGIHALLRTPTIGGKVDDGVKVHVRSTRKEGTAFGPTFPMEETSYLNYERSLYRLNYGPYEACLMADFKPGPSIEPELPVLTTYTDKAEFFVAAAEPCEQWADAAAGTGGWTFDGIFDADSGEAVATSGSAPFFGRTDFGLTVLTGPLTTDGAPGDLWKFDLVSPDVSADANWQGLPEIALNISTNTGIQIFAQPIFTYLYEDGSLQDLAPADDGGFIFYELTGGSTVYAPTMRPGDVTLTQIRVRIFAPYVITTSEFFVHLGLICPMPSRLPSLIQAVLGELAAAGDMKAAPRPGGK